MKYLSVKKILWTFIIISSILYGILFLFGSIFDFQDHTWFYVTKIPLCVTLTLAFMRFLDKFLWKWKFLYPWLIPIPDLNGCWEGTLISSYINPETGEKPAEIKVTANIEQILSHQSCVMKTKEMKSTSFIADFDIDKKAQRLNFIYSYESKPEQGEIRVRSPIHCGTTLFQITMDKKRAITLEGEYWTGRGTTGNIYLNRKLK